MGLISPLSRYRLYWRMLGAVSAILLLYHIISIRDTIAVEQQSDDHLNPIKKLFRPRPPVCEKIQGLEDIFVVLKTGANEAHEKLPVHFATTLQCVPNYAIYSDLEETVAGHHVHDALDKINPEIVATHPDFVYYQNLKKGGTGAFSADEVEQWKHAQNSVFGRDSPGWRLDKWKFLQVAEKALKEMPDAKWFVFMETDTYIMWSQLLLWLGHFWEQYPYYLGVQMQIGDDVFAYGGAGFVLSNTALRMVVKQYKLKRKYYDQLTGDHWAGDCVLGIVAKDAGINLQWSWPNLYGEKPNDMNFSDDFAGDDMHLWCNYASSYHHMTPADMVQLHEFENAWKELNGRTLRHKDIFRQYLFPQMMPLKADWDNLSDEVRDESSSLEECRSLCEADSECMQFTIKEETCSTSKIVKLGQKSTAPPMQVNSGWMMDRVSANQGVGYETAKNLVLSAAEYHVILGSRDTSKGEAAAEELRSSPGIKGTISMEQIDVTDQQSIEEAAGRIESKYGRLDILVNNAGIISMASPPTTNALRRVLETNVIGALGVTEAFVPLLRKAASAAAGSSTARVVFVTSSMGSISHAANPTSPYYSPNATEYRVSKAALNMMMTMYGARLKPDGILVFGADPGLCATNFTGDPRSLRKRGAVDASEGGGRIAAVIKTENVDDAGKVHGVYGVCPW